MDEHSHQYWLWRHGCIDSRSHKNQPPKQLASWLATRNSHHDWPIFSTRVVNSTSKTRCGAPVATGPRDPPSWGPTVGPNHRLEMVKAAEKPWVPEWLAMDWSHGWWTARWKFGGKQPWTAQIGCFPRKKCRSPVEKPEMVGEDHQEVSETRNRWYRDHHWCLLLDYIHIATFCTFLLLQ